ncbi:MAG: hypothetical protein FWD31_03290 [Planctomycetaceae bacterium]|nr:hypothetical protein [Planctomycetaceae bacterium]
MAGSNCFKEVKSGVTHVKYDQLHQLILFFRYTALAALWLSFCIFFFRVVFVARPETQGGLPLIYVVICSTILFLSAIFSHHILEWDHFITSLRYPTGRWRCHCNCCLARRRTGNISRLTPSGLHGILANRHTWTFLPAGLTFFLLLLLTDARWPFLVMIVHLFVVAEIVFFRISCSAVAACRAGFNESLQLPGTVKPIADNKTRTSRRQTSSLPFRALMAGAREEEIGEEHGEVLFAMKRSVTLNGQQRIDGWVKTTFRFDQMQVTQNIPFTPAFDRIPQVTLEPESELNVVLEEPVVMLHGMRFDIKRRRHDDEACNTVIVHFAVESVHQS